MKKRLFLAIPLAALTVFAAGCGLPSKNSVEQGGKNVFPTSRDEEDMPVNLGDVMPFYDDGVMNIYHLQNTTEGSFYHPIARLTTTDYLNYEYKGIAIPFEKQSDSPDAALGTGSFIKDKEGNYHCFYTGHNAIDDSGLPHIEAVRHAKSCDGQKTWVKDGDGDGKEKFLLYGADRDGRENNDFRDPYVYYNAEAEIYEMLVTTRQNGKGVIWKYSSPSLDAGSDGWRDDGAFFKEDGISYNMECPSFVEYNGYEYLAFSEQGDLRVTHYRYRQKGEETWQKAAPDAIDNTGFYAGRLEKGADGLYAFAWCAQLSGGSSGSYDWGGNLVVHKMEQSADGSLTAVMAPNIRRAFSTQVEYKSADKEAISDFSFAGDKFKAYGAEKLGKNVTRISFTVKALNKGGNFGISFGLDGKYNNRLGQSLLSFDTANNKITFYNGVSSAIHYGAPLASVPFEFEEGKGYKAEILVEGEIITAYVGGRIALTGRAAYVTRRNFSFYSNGAKAKIEGIKFYE